jgi:hypothetical protein
MRRPIRSLWAGLGTKDSEQQPWERSSWRQARISSAQWAERGGWSFGFVSAVAPIGAGALVSVVLHELLPGLLTIAAAWVLFYIAALAVFALRSPAMVRTAAATAVHTASIEASSARETESSLREAVVRWCEVRERLSQLAALGEERGAVGPTGPLEPMRRQVKKEELEGYCGEIRAVIESGGGHHPKGYRLGQFPSDHDLSTFEGVAAAYAERAANLRNALKENLIFHAPAGL